MRYAVLAQLLTLNFHEHFELKPLLQDADDRLSEYKGPVAPGGHPEGARATCARRRTAVIQRQIAQLWDDKIAPCTPAAGMETTFQFVSDPDLEDSFSQSDDAATVLVSGRELKSFTVSSPDCRDELSIVSTSRISPAENVHVLITPAAPDG